MCVMLKRVRISRLFLMYEMFGGYRMRIIVFCLSEFEVSLVCGVGCKLRM